MPKSVFFEELEALFREYLKRFTRQMVFFSGGTKEDAEDVYAESQFRAFRYFANFRIGDDPQRVYLSWRCRIIVNIWRDELRRKRCLSVVSLESYFSNRFSGNNRFDLDTDEIDLPDPDIDVENQVVKSMARSLSWKLIKLAFLNRSSVFFQCFKLYYCDGLSCEEVADVLHCPLSTVRVRLHRARKLLRQKLADNITFT